MGARNCATCRITEARRSPTEEVPEFANAPAESKSRLAAWEREQARHASAIKRIEHAIHFELMIHLLDKEKYRGDAAKLSGGKQSACVNV